MSTRILRRLQEEGKLDVNISSEPGDNEENVPATGCGGARRKKLPANPYDVLMKTTQSESEEQEDQDDPQNLCDRRKKKKKRRKGGKEKILKETNIQEIEFKTNNIEDVLDQNNIEGEIQNKIVPLVKAPKEVCEIVREELNIKVRNLNVNNELKKMFGSKVVDNESRLRNRGRVQLKNTWLVTPKENWPALSKTGLSMRFERTNGICSFSYVHNNDYQKIQGRFLRAVNSFNQENIAAIVYSHPYHVDALIQLSDLYKLTDDLQTAADLNERALYSLESAFHPLFNMARGVCKLDYRRQENRALFICLFKHLTFIGQRACYQTALEICKLLLSFDFELDPLAIVLCIDFYALRSRNYAWLIDAGKRWEKKKNISQLPNFAFSVALAHFFIAESAGNQDFSQADKLLQDALISFPSLLNLLLEKCSVRPDYSVAQHHFFNSDVELTQSRPLAQLITLYVHRTYCEWKRSNVIQWLDKNAREVMRRVDSGENIVKECLLLRLRNYCSTPRNVLRHIILSDIKEVTATIATIVTSPILSFDPVPPLDSIDLYSYADFSKYNEESQSLTSLFFASLLPNFHVNRREDELAVAEAGRVVDPVNENGEANAQNTRREGVMMLLDAIGAIVASRQGNRQDINENNNQENVRRDINNRHQNNGTE